MPEASLEDWIEKAEQDLTMLDLVCAEVSIPFTMACVFMHSNALRNTSRHISSIII